MGWDVFSFSSADVMLLLSSLSSFVLSDLFGREALEVRESLELLDWECLEDRGRVESWWGEKYVLEREA